MLHDQSGPRGVRDGEFVPPAHPPLSRRLFLQGHSAPLVSIQGRRPLQRKACRHRRQQQFRLRHRPGSLGAGRVVRDHDPTHPVPRGIARIHTDARIGGVVFRGRQGTRHRSRDGRLDGDVHAVPYAIAPMEEGDGRHARDGRRPSRQGPQRRVQTRFRPGRDGSLRQERHRGGRVLHRRRMRRPPRTGGCGCRIRRSGASL
mmetsp:Transcript_42755/g.129944  ORF Transcript_42755/g.129944 Transcript_42755/m.129944 type:complete len:202 (+) Transcript_42755:986-1591(+)